MCQEVEKTTITVRLSRDLNSSLIRWAQLNGIKKSAAIVFLLSKQVSLWRYNTRRFDQKMKTRRFKKTEMFSDFVPYSFKVSSQFHEDLLEIANVYGFKINQLVINMLRNELEDGILNFLDVYEIKSTDSDPKLLQNIHTSVFCYDFLKQTAKSIGLSVNGLVSQIIGEYVRDHIDYYDS